MRAGSVGCNERQRGGDQIGRGVSGDDEQLPVRVTWIVPNRNDRSWLAGKGEAGFERGAPASDDHAVALGQCTDGHREPDAPNVRGHAEPGGHDRGGLHLVRRGRIREDDGQLPCTLGRGIEERDREQREVVGQRQLRAADAETAPWMDRDPRCSCRVASGAAAIQSQRQHVVGGQQICVKRDLGLNVGAGNDPDDPDGRAVEDQLEPHLVAQDARSVVAQSQRGLADDLRHRHTEVEVQRRPRATQCGLPLPGDVAQPVPSRETLTARRQPASPEPVAPFAQPAVSRRGPAGLRWRSPPHVSGLCPDRRTGEVRETASTCRRSPPRCRGVTATRSA